MPQPADADHDTVRSGLEVVVAHLDGVVCGEAGVGEWGSLSQVQIAGPHHVRFRDHDEVGHTTVARETDPVEDHNPASILQADSTGPTPAATK
jgi:hypothetical protein